jgi:hypothetical protein
MPRCGDTVGPYRVEQQISERGILFEDFREREGDIEGAIHTSYGNVIKWLPGQTPVGIVIEDGNNESMA